MLSLRSLDHRLPPAGEHNAVRRADGPRIAAVRGDREHDSHVSAGVRSDGDSPADIAGLLEPLGLGDRAAGDLESVVAEVAEAQLHLMTEPDFEGERRLAVMSFRDAFEGHRQRLGRGGIDGSRRRAGERLGVAGVVGERHPHLDGCARVGVRQLVGRAGRAVDGRVIAKPLVAERRIGQAVGVRDARRIRRQRLAHFGRAADGQERPSPGGSAAPPPRPSPRW